MKTHQITINDTRFVLTEELGIILMSVRVPARFAVNDVEQVVSIEMTKAQCAALGHVLAVLGKPDREA